MSKKTDNNNPNEMQLIVYVFTETRHEKEGEDVIDTEVKVFATKASAIKAFNEAVDCFKSHEDLSKFEIYGEDGVLRFDADSPTFEYIINIDECKVQI